MFSPISKSMHVRIRKLVRETPNVRNCRFEIQLEGFAVGEKSSILIVAFSSGARVFLWSTVGGKS